MTVAVIEVHLVEDGHWEALERHVFSGDDLDTVDDLEELSRVNGLVRVGGALKPLTVYVTGDDEGVVTWNEAYGA